VLYVNCIAFLVETPSEWLWMSEVMYSIANDRGKNILLLRPQVILNLGHWVKVLRVRRRGRCLAVLGIQVCSLLSWLTRAIEWRAVLCACARHGSMYSCIPCLSKGTGNVYELYFIL